MRFWFEQIIELLTNYILMSAVIAWLVAQIIKAVISLIAREKFDLGKFLFGSGGMPSSHSAFVMALCTATGFTEGLGSSIFAVSCGLAVIVMIDASGVRFESGEQAKILNKITRELFSGKPDEINTGLKELIGHTPFQVMMGAALGVGVGITISFIAA